MSKPATLIYTHGGGRLGNQIIRLAHWLAWTRAHPSEVNVIDLGFWRYARYFTHWHKEPGCAFPRPSSAANLLARLQDWVPETLRSRIEPRFQRLVHAMGSRWLGGGAIALNDPAEEALDLADPRFLAKVMRERVTMCSGWKIACWPLVAGQQAELREYFQPRPEWREIAAAFVARLRPNHDLVVGVQIRQSDYRTWNRGRFHFSTERYAGWMRELLDLHPGRRVAFIVVSEEPQDAAWFAGLPVYFASGSANGGGHWFESWGELSLCDLVLSPPSTFSTTAAWVGKVPLWPVTNVGQQLAPNQVLHDVLLEASRHGDFSQCVQ